MMRWPIRPHAPFMPKMVFMRAPSFSRDAKSSERSASTPVAYAPGSPRSEETSSRLSLRIYLNRLDDLVQIIGHLNRPVGIGRPPHAALAQHLIEGLLIGRMIRDGRRRIF